MRRDAWWLELLPIIALLGAFGIYATLRAFEGAYYEWGPYLSPFYSPLIYPHHRWWPFSPALLILIWPLGFRVTCYYYRKAYYRAFFPDPPACAVGESGRHRYKGETAFPFILQDSRSRTRLLKDELGIGLCNITKCCTEVCPEEIHITDNAIIPLKERVVDEFYDPVLMLVRKIRGTKQETG